MDYSGLVIAAIVGTALVAGLIANRYVRPFAKSEIQGVKLEALVGPIVSLTVLLIAFTLVTVFASFQRGQTAAADEARKVDNQFETAQYLNEPERQEVLAATTCYALAVSTYEWEAMADGRTASEVSPWTKAIRAGYADMVKADNVPSGVMSALLAADRDRAEARSKRLTEARPAVPTELKFLLVLSASLGILALGTFTLGYISRKVQIGVLSILALVFVLFLAAISDMDRPYDGIIAAPPDDITRVAGELLEDYQEMYPGKTLPCDETGRSLQA
jgi:hypothetical protein